MINFEKILRDKIIYARVRLGRCYLKAYPRYISQKAILLHGLDALHIGHQMAVYGEVRQCLLNQLKIYRQIPWYKVLHRKNVNHALYIFCINIFKRSIFIQIIFTHKYYSIYTYIIYSCIWQKICVFILYKYIKYYAIQGHVY